MIGRTISHYRVLDKLGEGGMGVVYKAEDTKLGRTVALKFLPAHLLGEDLRKRFEREAKSAAALSHSNVCVVHEIDERDGETFIAMELVEGESLDKLIAQGPLRLDEALSIAQQVAKGLEAAHQRGIVHRDIKPENVMVGDDRHVTIMDFGLAQLTEASRLTKTDETVGTVAYMSPEQTEGSGTDQRTDIWSLGVVLYEMITGQQPFKGDYDKAVMYSILNEQPEPLTGLRTGVPTDLERLVDKCIAKSREDRYQGAAELLVDLRRAAAGFDRNHSRWTPTAAAPKAAASRELVWRVLPWAISCLLTAVLALSWLASEGKSILPPPAHLKVLLPEGVHLAVDTEHPTLVLSPDGSKLVFVGDDRGIRRLYVRDLADQEARALDGSEGAASPFFSPDGKWIAYFDGGGIKKVATGGGVPMAVHETTPVGVNRGAAWIDKDAFVIATSVNSGLARGAMSPANASSIDQLVDIARDASAPYSWPAALPGGEVIFTDNSAGAGAESQVALLSPDSGSIETILNGGSHPKYASTAHVLFARSGALYATPFDADGHRTTGAEHRLIDRVMTNAGGAAQFTVAGSTLAYVAGSQISNDHELVWVDREGRTEPFFHNERYLANPKLSPDGKLVAVTSRDGPNVDVWTLDLERSVFTRITSDPGEDFDAIWSPNGRSLAFSTEMHDTDGEDGPALAWISAPGQTPELLLSRTTGRGNWEFPVSWTPDGKRLAFLARRVGGAADIYLVEPGSHADPEPLLVTPAREIFATFSPDGNWVAYVSDESGQPEVYVRPFAAPGPALQISPGGGSAPVWARSGRELFYRTGNKMMSVTVGSGAKLEPGPPKPLFEARFVFEPDFGGVPNYDVSLDASRFLMVRRSHPVAPTVIDVVLNWPAVFGLADQ